jgi:phosphoribosylglycinamide formyltransferase-1
MIINQHPGPLDPGRSHDFGGHGMFGKRVHYTRLNFVKETNKNWWTEATCHRVTAEYDKGAILDRIQVEIKENDTVESLADRVLLAEHALQIKVLEDFANKSIQEWQRPEPLVKNYEEKILTRLKEEAIKLYPNG